MIKGGGDFADRIKLRILKRGHESGFFHAIANKSQGFFSKGDHSERLHTGRSRGRMKLFEDGGMDHGPTGVEKARIGFFSSNSAEREALPTPCL